MACTSRLLRSLASLDSLWRSQFIDQFAGLLPLLAAAPPAWWGSSWCQRFASLASGAEFSAQVFNREIDNLHEDFCLSSCEGIRVWHCLLLPLLLPHG